MDLDFHLTIYKIICEDETKTRSDGPPWYLIGIVSYGAPNCEAAIPEVYVREVHQFGSHQIAWTSFKSSGYRSTLIGFKKKFEEETSYNLWLTFTKIPPK